MSHFTVLVPAADEQELDEKLLPYYEYGCSHEYDEKVKPWLEFKVEHRAESFKEDALDIVKSDHVQRDEKLKAEYESLYESEDYASIFRDWDGGESCPETGNWGYWHNPSAKWDWYTIGGRWSSAVFGDALATPNCPAGMAAKEANAEELCKALFQRHQGEPETLALISRYYQEGRTGELRKLAASGTKRLSNPDCPMVKEVYFDLLREEKRIKAEMRWLEYQEEFGLLYTFAHRWVGLLFHLAWPFACKIRIGKRLGDAFWGLMRKLSDSEKSPNLEFGVEIGESKRHFIERSSGALTWALITREGEWLEKAEMGWFALSTNYQGRKYFKRFWKEVLSWPPEQRMYVVDCHI